MTELRRSDCASSILPLTFGWSVAVCGLHTSLLSRTLDIMASTWSFTAEGGEVLQLTGLKCDVEGEAVGRSGSVTCTAGFLGTFRLESALLTSRLRNGTRPIFVAGK